MTSPLPLVNVDQPKQEKSSSFLVINIQNLTTLKLGEGEGRFYIVRNRVKGRNKLIDDEYSLVSQ